MRRRLTTLALLIPLSINGMWMVCANSPVAEAADASATHEASATCDKMCALIKEHRTTASSLDPTGSADGAQPGDVCFLPANGDGNWNAVAALAAAMPSPIISVHAEVMVTEASQEQPVTYIDPSLAGSTPPPKA